MWSDVLRRVPAGDANPGRRIALAAVFLGLAAFYARGPRTHPLNPVLLALAGGCFLAAAVGTLAAGDRSRYDRIATVGLAAAVADAALLAALALAGVVT